MTERPAGHGVPETWTAGLRGPEAQGTFFGDRGDAPVLVAFARSSMSDWTAVVEVPWTGATAPIRRTLRLLAVAGAVLAIAAAAVALLAARGADRPIQALRTSAALARARQREAETRYRTYWQHTGEALFVLAVTGDVRFVFEGLNPAHERLSGLNTASVAGHEPHDCLGPGMAAALVERCRRCVESGEAMRYEEALDLPAGRRDWETSLAPVWDNASGRIVRLLGSARDVTDRRRSEAALRESEERLRLAQDAASIATWEWDLATGAIRWSRAMDAIRGAESAGAGDGPLTTWARIVHPEDRERVEADMAEAVAARRPFRCEYRALSSRGDGLRWLLSRGRVASSAAAAADAPRRVLGVVMDITDRKRTEHERDEALALFRGIAETSPDIVYVLELSTGRISYVNGRVADVLGYGPDELDAVTEDTLQAFFHPVDAAGAGDRLRVLGALANGEVATGEYRLRHRDGGWRWLAGRETVFERGGDGAVTRVLGCAHDITEVRLAEEAVRRLGGSLLTLQDDERRRIARELHDSTAQVLLGASFATQRIRAVSPVLTEDADDAVEEVLSLIEEGQREIRTLAYLLHPPLLDEMGLPAALRWYAKGLARRSGLAIAVEVAPELAGRRLPRDVESALFRVAQEALGNACRHSGGTMVQVRMGTNAGALPGDACCAVLLAVQDDGRGIAGAQAAPATEDDDPIHFGVGLVGMRERMRQLGGRLTVEPAGPRGTIVEASLPIDSALGSGEGSPPSRASVAELA